MLELTTTFLVGKKLIPLHEDENWEVGFNFCRFLLNYQKLIGPRVQLLLILLLPTMTHGYCKMLCSCCTLIIAFSHVLTENETTLLNLRVDCDKDKGKKEEIQFPLTNRFHNSRILCAAFAISYKSAFHAISFPPPDLERPITSSSFLWSPPAESMRR